MLKLTIKKSKDEGIFNNATQEFITLDHDVTICLEHSLVSISKWESKYNKPFLSEDKKTTKEFRDYVKCMTISQNIDDLVYYFLTKDDYEKIRKYIDAPMTATTFYRHGQQPEKPRKKEIITSELIYYWMVAANVPFECQRWHLNRLLTLLHVCSVKNSNNKMKKKDILRSNAALNAARRSKTGSKG